MHWKFDMALASSGIAKALAICRRRSIGNQFLHAADLAFDARQTVQ